MDFADYANVMVGVAEGIMIIDGIVYCETCWKTKLGPEDCSCVGEAVVTCALCISLVESLELRGHGKPCAACYPARFENWTAAMAALDEIMAPYEEGDATAEAAEEAWDPEMSFSDRACENCFWSYKDVKREQPPCWLCKPAFKDAWSRARYGALSCDTCTVVYSPTATTVCSACDPKFIEDICGPQCEADEDRYGRAWCRQNSY